MVDSYYTDSVLADKLVGYIPADIEIHNVVDFCVGGGELLNAALRRYSHLQCTGVDSDLSAIEKLRIDCPHWKLIHEDFLNHEQISNEISDKKFDLILLNPPFSCKGSQIKKCVFDSVEFKTSTSMTFVLNALKYLSKDGIMLCILPISVIYSQKDRVVWDYLKLEYNAHILTEIERYSFKGCAPGIVLVSFNYNYHNKYKKSIASIKFPATITINRGHLSMHKLCKTPHGPLYLVHTTNLSDNQIRNLSHKINTKSIATGPSVLIPRVCNPNISKVAVLYSGERYAISDCIISLQVQSNEDAVKLYKLIIDSWENFKSLYTGTGAKYITVDRLKMYFGII